MKALSKWIARLMRPMPIVEDEELSELCTLLGEFGGFKVDLTGRTQIRESIVSDAAVLRDRLRSESDRHSGYYCLTTDIWTDRSARSYIAKLRDLLDGWNLDPKKFAMLVRDGANNARKGASSSGLSHMSCIAHSLQLVLAGALMRSRKASPSKTKGKKNKSCQKAPAQSSSKDTATPSSTIILTATDIVGTMCHTILTAR
jgi:hypothetical protein